MVLLISFGFCSSLTFAEKEKKGELLFDARFDRKSKTLVIEIKNLSANRMEFNVESLRNPVLSGRFKYTEKGISRMGGWGSASSYSLLKDEIKKGRVIILEPGDSVKEEYKIESWLEDSKVLISNALSSKPEAILAIDIRFLNLIHSIGSIKEEVYTCGPSMPIGDVSEVWPALIGAPK